MKTIGVILIVLGILGFVFDNISFTRSEEVADIGPVEVEKQERESIPITPIAAGGAIVIGIGLFAAGARREKAGS